MSDDIWLTWESQRRNRSMAKRLGAQLYELNYRGNSLCRYWVLGWRTIWIVRRVRPRIIYFQNPSLVLSLLIASMRFLGLTRARAVGDFHNAGVHPPVARFLVPWLARKSELIIVSNRNLRTQIEKMGGKGIAIPDPIPDIDVRNTTRVSEGFQILCICSWADDEPVREILIAANITFGISPDMRFVITGHPKLEKIGWTESLPKNVELKGFLSEQHFDELLAGSDAILDLTTRPDCMVCGAYEAISVGTPMILSDNQPSRAYFDSGALFTDNSAQDIVRAVTEMRRRHSEMKAGVKRLHEEVLDRESRHFQELEFLLHQR